jgi:hypothetical protein
MPCSPCVTSSARYMFSLLSLKCSKYICRSVACDRNVFAKGFNKIELEKKKLELAHQLALKQAVLKSTKALSLNYYIKLL